MIRTYDFNNYKDKKQVSVVGRERILVWPCNLYRVTLPRLDHTNDREFNFFEWCILKMLAYHRYEPKDLAEETCLPEDLIEVILLRLFDLGKIDKYYQLLPEVRAAIEKLDATRDLIPVEYATYVVFQECMGGRLLPMLFEKELKAVEILEDGTLNLHSKKYRPWTLHAETNHYPPPTPRDISSFCNTSFADYISVSPNSESCNLIVHMVLQKDTEWRIRDPFGGTRWSPWAPTLEFVYSNLLKEDPEEEKSFQKWYHNNMQHISRNNDDVQRKREPYDTDRNSFLYPELINTLKRNSDTDVYSALEWVLFYAIQNVDTKQIIFKLSYDSPDRNIELFDKTVESLVRRYRHRDDSPDKEQEQGQDTEKTVWKLPLPGKLKSYQDDKMAEMQVVLPLAILVSQENPDFPFHRVMQAYPDCLSMIAELKTRRDQKRHGRTPWREIYNETDRAFMRETISLLLPSVQFGESQSEPNTSGSVSEDYRFHARYALCEYFGVSNFGDMESILQEDLIQAEIFWQNNREKQAFDALDGINYLYAAAQGAFHAPLLKGDPLKVVSPDEAREKSKWAGWGELPKTLSSVRGEMIQETLYGNAKTLGACIVAWILLAKPQSLREKVQRLPSLPDIDKFLAARGHGNQTRMMGPDEFGKYRSTIYKLIKTIMEE